MGMTMTQKILAAHAGLPSVEAGQLIEADLDLVLGNDITSPVAIHEMDEKMKDSSVFHKDKIALVLDHFVPNKDINPRSSASVSVNLPADMRLRIILMLAIWGLNTPCCPKKGLWWLVMW